MRVFSHGCNINFSESTREMFAPDLNKIIQQYIKDSDSVLFGMIHLEEEALYVFGRAQQVVIDEPNNRFAVTYMQMEKPLTENIELPFENLEISHEAIFDVIDEQKGQVQYRVIYVSFWDEGEKKERTYFFADEHLVSNPLECVAAFWEQVTDVGRDVDFNMTGCTAHDRRSHLKP
ncbi:hypothetical protein [Thermoflavimicrobium dichotomicum]|uniref:Uncharacterized protein n=1 Tax=Thermoflavimicrobium dichotomicum TaxID=46223 RepID=A0A1I3MSH6_9BACL|nr:hypothetical protein [Thermoflavimicrobium dichotomicum]SFI99891.1 hypothetical protein SAMN05421852_103182 [Thermoflavimicrobium dichotomicum]